MITMENKQRIKTIAVIFIIAIVLISLMTEFLYTFNNKYTYNKLQPEKGVLTLSQEEIDNNSFHFLIKDWEFYENALLTPTYFKNQTSLPNMKYISIGDTESAYTSQTKNNIFIGTYRIKINFPEKEGFYALEMPQVYSAYELYINNKLYLKVGDTHNYKAQIQNRCTFFNASGETYITIAVKDASGIRAGITSPPTLGKPYSINITRAFKFLINNFIMTLIFFGALFSLILAIFYKQFSFKMLYDSLIDTAKTSAMVFIILFGASAFTGIFMSLDGDQLIATWISSVGIGKWGAFAIMMAIVFVMGMFLDWLGIVMIVFPIFLPIMDMFGFDRLWIVAVTAVMLQTCFMTPPFGFALFYIKGIVPPSVKIQEIYRGVIPFILIIIAVVILVTVFPQIVYFLPNLVAS